MKPFCAIYSTFLQRAYDQVIHDVAVQHLPVRFAIDRAGYVGADGPTHAGNYDPAYLGADPRHGGDGRRRRGRAAPHGRDRRRLRRRPDRLPLSARRRPRRRACRSAAASSTIGKGRILREGTSVALLCYGTRLGEVLAAAEKLAAFGLSPTVADARFMKPLDDELIARLAREHEVLLTIEEGGIGGFGSHVATFLAQNGLLDGKLKFRPLMIPDTFVEQASQTDMYADAGLDRAGIVAAALRVLGMDAEVMLKKGRDAL